MDNKYEITLKDINQEIELLLTQLNLLIEVCNNSNNIDDLKFIFSTQSVVKVATKNM